MSTKLEDIEVEDVDFEAMLEESFKKRDTNNDLVEEALLLK